MRRTAFDSNRDVQVANEHLDAYRPCSFCGQPTEVETLIDYGARCGVCFTSYVTQGKRRPPMPSREQMLATVARLKGLTSGSQHPRAWAHRLKVREESGERLSGVQKAAWRSVLPDVVCEQA